MFTHFHVATQSWFGGLERMPLKLGARAAGERRSQCMEALGTLVKRSDLPRGALGGHAGAVLTPELAPGELNSELDSSNSQD